MQTSTYASFVKRVVVLSSGLGLLLFLIYGVAIRSGDNIESVKLETQHTSQLIFEVVYTAMQKGWGQEEIDGIIGRIHETNPDLSIRIYRSPLVAELFGPREGQKERLLREEDAIGLTEKGEVEYLYPVRFKQECLSCHANAQEGAVAGMLELTFPVSSIKLNTSLVFKLFAVAFVITVVSIFLVLFVSIKRQFIRPLNALVREIDGIMSHNDLERNIHIHSRIAELQHVETVFNRLTSLLADSYHKVKISSEIDELTKVYNRTKLREMIVGEGIERGRTALVLFDLDRFKGVNDTHGHDAGDMMLLAFAQAIKHNVKRKDAIFRLGGDEFLLLCPDTDSAEAEVVVSHVKKELQTHPLRFSGREQRVEFSYGIALYNDEVTDFAAAMKEADSKMFSNKRAKRAAFRGMPEL